MDGGEGPPPCEERGCSVLEKEQKEVHTRRKRRVEVRTTSDSTAGIRSGKQSIPLHPKDTPKSPMALGNQATCNYTGGFLHLGGTLATVFISCF